MTVKEVGIAIAVAQLLYVVTTGYYVKRAYDSNGVYITLTSAVFGASLLTFPSLLLTELLLKYSINSLWFTIPLHIGCLILVFSSGIDSVQDLLGNTDDEGE